MEKKKIKTHRCKGSLNSRLSIRCTTPYSVRYKEDEVAWRLFSIEESDYDCSRYLSHITEINYCPFCGEKLEKDTESKEVSDER